MPKRDDLLRAREYGRDPYFTAIQAEPAYQTTLQKLKESRPEKSWIQSPFALPRFSTAEFEAQRLKYQEKYGSKINVPGFEDVIQWKSRVLISNEDMAAHVYAQKRGLPSPLTDEQIEQLSRNKARFLRMLQSPENRINRGASAIMTAFDNAEDALVTFGVLGRLGRYAAPKALGRITPVLGWAQGAADVLNLFNVAAAITKKAYANKRALEKNLDKNPFHKKYWTQRASGIKKTWPAFGEILEIAQTTDQMFGWGLCLGGIMGTMNDVLTKGAEQVLRFGVNVAVTAQYPSAYREIWADAIDSASIVWNAKDWVDKQTLAEVTLAASLSLETLIPTWIQVESPEFLEIMKAAGSRRKPAVNNVTKYLMDGFGMDPEATPNWPGFEQITVDLDELALTYAPIIKDNFQTYLLENQYTPEGLLTGQAASDYHGSLIAAFSDDHTAQVSQTAIAGAVKDMALSTLLIPPETPQATIENLAEWITKYERDHGSQPSAKEIQITGIGMGINWTRKYPEKITDKAAEIWPKWQAIQDQLQNLHLADFE